MGLLNLPAEALHLILSFLGVMSLAAVQLTCRALRDAGTNGRRHVIEGWCTATARASQSVLQSMHVFQLLMDAEQGEMDTNFPAPPDRPESPDSCYSSDNSDVWGVPERSNRERQHVTHLLTDVAQEVESLTLEKKWYDSDLDYFELPKLTAAVVAQMRQLRTLCLEGKLDVTTVEKLPALRHLTCLKIGRPCDAYAIHKLFSTIALSHLAIEDYTISKHILDPLFVAGKVLGLQDLHLLCATEDAQQLLRGLTALSALTALSVSMQKRHMGVSGDLGGLAALTALKSLRIRPLRPDGPVFMVESLSPLSALIRVMTGLTLLDLLRNNASWSAYCAQSHVSVLSTLTALRVLRCDFALDKAEFEDGDPLPVHLRFLRTAAALEELELGAVLSHLPDDAVRAAGEAVCALSSLKRVSIRTAHLELGKYIMALSSFAAASSIESFSFRHTWLSYKRMWHPLRVQARGYFTALSKLRSLFLEGRDVQGHAYFCADLLAGLPSSHLTCLSLGVQKANVQLMQQIVRFHDLQDLALHSPPVESECLGQLFKLKGLTRLLLIGEEHEKLRLIGLPKMAPLQGCWAEFNDTGTAMSALT